MWLTKSFLQILMVFFIFCETTISYGANLSDLASEGYAVVAETYIEGEFNGCEYDKKIRFANRQIFTCRSYSYSYSYRPKVQILKHVQYGSTKILIGDREYSGDYSGGTSSNTTNYLRQIEENDRITARINAEITETQRQLNEINSRRLAPTRDELVPFYGELDRPSQPTATEYENTQEAVNATAAAVYKVYPFLDVDNKKANSQAIEAVRSRTKEYVSAGYTLSVSLLNAVNDIGPLYDTKKKKKRAGR